MRGQFDRGRASGERHRDRLQVRPRRRRRLSHLSIHPGWPHHATGLIRSSTMTMYAYGTSTSINYTRGEIERLIRRYGADQLGYAEDAGRAMLGFRVQGRAVRFVLDM